MRAVVILAVLLGSGCSAYQKQMGTRFERLGGDEFRFEADAGIDHAESSPGAEAERWAWIAEYVRDNKVCRGGFEITERKPILVRQALLGPVHRIYYRGRCKS